MGVQAPSGMAPIAARTCGFIATVTEKNAPAARTAPHAADLHKAEPIRTTIVPVHPAARAVLTDPAAKDAAPRAEFAVPPRSRVAAITGAPSGVLIVATSTFSPRTSRLLPWILVWPNPAPCFLC